MRRGSREFFDSGAKAWVGVAARPRQPHDPPQHRPDPRLRRQALEGGVSSDEAANFLAQARQQLAFEPWVGGEPGIVAPRGVRQADPAWLLTAGEQLAPGPHRGGHAAGGCRSQVPALRIAADGEEQLKLRHRRKQAPMPPRLAFGPRWQVAAAGIVAGKTKAHGHDGNAVLIVEFRRRQSKPAAQAVAGGIAERHPRGMHANAGCLAADDEARRRARPQHRSRLMRQWRAQWGVAADPAGANLAQQAAQLPLRAGHSSMLSPSSASRTRGSRMLLLCASIASPMCVSIMRLAPMRSSSAAILLQLM